MSIYLFFNVSVCASIHVRNNVQTYNHCPMRRFTANRIVQAMAIGDIPIAITVEGRRKLLRKRLLLTCGIFVVLAATKAGLATIIAADARPAIAARRGDGTASGHTRIARTAGCGYTGPHFGVRRASRLGPSSGSGRYPRRHRRASVVDADETGSSSQSA